jgi:NDP-sugar pyrophosphorylase family protein
MYVSKNLNIVIPMAGLGKRFADQGYTLPKPLIRFHGKPMIEHVINNINIDANYTFIVQQEHIDKFNITNILRHIVPNCNIVALNGITDGAARSLLHAKRYINNINPLLIVNSDSLIEWKNIDIMHSFEDKDGGIILIEASGPSWSYAMLDADGFATKIAEKIEISTHATTGHYYWKRGQDFVRFAETMIERDIRFNNEFYTAPVYNIAIEKGLKIYTRYADKFWSVGTPEELNFYLKHHPAQTD